MILQVIVVELVHFGLLVEVAVLVGDDATRGLSKVVT